MPSTLETKPLPKDDPRAPKRQRRQPGVGASQSPEPPVPVLPAPKKFSLYSADDFFRYWSQVDTASPDRVLCYVYRVWPKIDRTKAGIEPDANKYIDKLHKALPADPAEWKPEMLHRYGSGAYKMVLTDGLARVAGGGTKTLCQTVVPSKDLDDEDYPPVLDLSELDMNHPENQSYIRNLEIKGILHQESEMQQAEAVKEMAGLVREVVRDSRQQPTPAPAADPTGTAEAIKATAAAMANVATMGNELMKNAFTQVATATADQSSPKTMLDMLSALANILTARQEHKGDDELSRALLQRETELRREIEGMRTSMFAFQSERIKALEDDIKAARANPNPQPAPGSLSETLKTFRELREAAAELVPGGEESSGKMPWWASMVQSIANAVPALGAMVVQATYNLALARGVNPARPATSPPVPAPMPVPIPPRAPAHDGETPAPGVQEVPTGYAAMVSQLEGPLARHLNEGLTGDDFANGIVQLFGLGAYRQARALGPDIWRQLLTMRPLIAPLIESNPRQFDEFLDQFMRAEQIWSEQDASAETAPVS